jgi:hypothetical protein
VKPLAWKVAFWSEVAIAGGQVGRDRHRCLRMSRRGDHRDRLHRHIEMSARNADLVVAPSIRPARFTPASHRQHTTGPEPSHSASPRVTASRVGRGNSRKCDLDGALPLPDAEDADLGGAV